MIDPFFTFYYYVILFKRLICEKNVKIITHFSKNAI